MATRGRPKKINTDSKPRKKVDLVTALKAAYTPTTFSRMISLSGLPTQEARAICRAFKD